MRPWRQTEAGRGGLAECEDSRRNRGGAEVCSALLRVPLRASAVLLGLVAATAPTSAQEDSSKSKDPPVSGLLLTRYRARWTSDESDQDLFTTLDLTFTGADRRWSGAVLARAAYDLDGRADPDSDFFGLLDTYDHRLEAQLFHAYIDLASDSLSVLRLGRQPLYETPVT